MKRPSLSIAQMMLVVAVVALDCLLMRLANSAPRPTLIHLALGGLPMQIALVIGLLRMFRRQRAAEKPLPFLMGFEVAGWIGNLSSSVNRSLTGQQRAEFCCLRERSKPPWINDGVPCPVSF